MFLNGLVSSTKLLSSRYLLLSRYDSRPMSRFQFWIGLLTSVLLGTTGPLALHAQDPVTYTSTTVDGQDAVRVSEGNGGGIEHPEQGANVTWTSDTTWILDGLIFVNEGQTLTIEPGTVIKGEEGTGTDASALVVARGGQIIADGTPEEPIIFTSIRDDLSTVDDLPPNARGLWGGIIVMGRAPLNTSPSVLNVEGITINDVRNQYGGTDPNDTSGVLRYISIRHGGSILEENNEINGLTLAGVGQGTTVEYVEVLHNKDDGFEFFGGTVDARYLISAFVTDDLFDMDQGYRGRGQFWLGIQNNVYADRIAEHDGGEASYGGEDQTPYATVTVANATYIGSGLDGAGGLGLMMRDNFAGSYLNSLFLDFPGAVLHIEDVPGDDTGDSRARFEDGTIRIEGNLFFEIGGTFVAGPGGEDLMGVVDNDGSFGKRVADSLAETNALASLLPIRNLGRNAQGILTSLDPRAANDAASMRPAAVPNDDFFRSVPYRGAFGEDDNWAASWSFLGQGGAAHPGLGLFP